LSVSYASAGAASTDPIGLEVVTGAGPVLCCCNPSGLLPAVAYRVVKFLSPGSSTDYALALGEETLTSASAGFCRVGDGDGFSYGL